MNNEAKYFKVKVTDSITSETHYIWTGPHLDAPTSNLDEAIKDYLVSNWINAEDFEIVESTTRDPRLPLN
jgi:hypothetical protein